MKKGFTLLEILLVIAAIGILAAIVIVAINPNRQLAQVRDAKRRSELRAVYQAVQQYAIENSELPPAIQSISDNTNEELCAQNATDCTDLIDLRSDLVPKYLAEIPSDPLYFTPDETGYLIGYHNGSLYVVQETREDEDSEYIAVGGLPENFEATRGRFTWTPADITTALWLDAADASTITESGGAVSEWRDKSGGGINFTQATSTARPSTGVDTLNSKNVITFDGTSDWMGAGDALDAVWTGNGFNVFFVAKNNAATSSSGLILGKVSNSPLNLRQFVSFVRTGVSQFAAFYNLGAAAYTGVNSSTSISNSQWVMYSQAYDNTLNVGASANTAVRVQMTVDGAEQTETVGFSAGNLGSIQDGAGVLSIGALVGDGTQFEVPLDGAIGELVVTPSVASVSDRQKIEGYFAHKWGLTYALPPTHPYKWDTSLFGGSDLSGFDADAKTYITAVETADQLDLEPDVRTAINDFVVGLKADGIWNAIKASTIMAGARTLSGALVPLKGTAPTNYNFVAGDYNRKTGLVGDGSTKYLDSNAPHNIAPQNNVHLSVFSQNNTVFVGGPINFYAGTLSGSATYIGGGDPNPNTWVAHDVGSLVPIFNNQSSIGFFAVARNSSSNFQYRIGAATTNVIRSASATAPGTGTFSVFARDGLYHTTARMAFYSIGESLDLALLDARVTDLMTAIGAAIP